MIAGRPSVNLGRVILPQIRYGCPSHRRAVSFTILCLTKFLLYATIVAYAGDGMSARVAATLPVVRESRWESESRSRGSKTTMSRKAKVTVFSLRPWCTLRLGVKPPLSHAHAEKRKTVGTNSEKSLKTKELRSYQVRKRTQNEPGFGRQMRRFESKTGSFTSSEWKVSASRRRLTT
jgi:hypothetical protein